MDVTVVVATFGDAKWRHLALHRALPSAKAQRVPALHYHADTTLQDARNGALAMVGTEWVIHLDADDELAPGYVEAMGRGEGDLRAPAVQWIRNGTPTGPPTFPKVSGHTHDCVGECLPYGNWLVVGAAVRADLVREVGGWGDYAWSEDWDLWLRCYLGGAAVTAVPDAVYRAHQRWRSRNHALPPQQRLEVHRAIAAANGVPIP